MGEDPGFRLLGWLIVGAVVGLALYVLAPAFSQPKRARQDYGSHRVVLACTLLAAVLGNLLAALYFVPTLRLGVPDTSAPGMVGQNLTPMGIAVAAISLDVALLAVVYLRIVRPGAVTWAAMGLAPSHWRRSLLPGLLFGALLFALSSLLEFLLAKVGIHQTQNALFDSVRRASFREFLLVLATAGIVAPIVEEIYFRGFVFRAYRDQKGPGRAYLYSAGLFALVHLNLPALLPIFAMGLLLSYLCLRTGSLLPAIIAHALNNSVAFGLIYLGIG